MKGRLSVALFWFIAALGAVALAQEKTPLDLAIDQYFSMEDKAAANAFLARALADGEKGKEAPRLIAEGYFYLGRAQYNLQELEAAEESLRKSVAANDSLEDNRNMPLKIDTMDLLGQVVGRQGRPASAVQVFGRVLQLKALDKGRTDRSRLTTMEYMAITYESAGQLRAAEFYRRAVLGIALATGQGAEDIAFWREALAGNLDKQERKDEAGLIRSGAAVEDVEGALFERITAGQPLIGTAEGRSHYGKIVEDFAATAGDSNLYLLALKDLAESLDQQDHGAVAAVYERAIEIEDRLLGFTPTQLGEFRYLAARERAFAGDIERAQKWFASLDEFGSDWVHPDVAERQRVVEAILDASSGEKAAAVACAAPAKASMRREEVLYAAYAIEQAMTGLGALGSRAPALQCGLSLAGPEAPVDLRVGLMVQLGFAQVENGNYREAIATLAEARKVMAGSSWAQSDLRQLLQTEALAYGWIREFDAAFRTLDEADKIGTPVGWEALSALRVRTVVLINAARYPEAEETVRKSLALLDGIAGARVAFDNDGASALNDFATVLVRAGRARDALQLIERIDIPDTLPADASKHAMLFYLDLRENRMRLLVSLGETDRAAEAAAAFRAAAIPVVDRLLAEAEPNRIVAATVAATINSGALAMVALGLPDEANAVAAKASALIAADQSDGVRLLSARVELVRGVAELSGGRPAEALPRFDRALEVGKSVLPADSDEMYEIWAGRGGARLAIADPAALGDLRQATRIAQARIATEARFDDNGVQRTMRPSFEALVAAAWRAAGT